MSESREIPGQFHAALIPLYAFGFLELFFIIFPGPSRRKSLRSSTRPSLFKIMDPSCISEHFGISLNSDSSSDDEEFIPRGAAAVSEGNLSLIIHVLQSLQMLFKFYF